MLVERGETRRKGVTGVGRGGHLDMKELVSKKALLGTISKGIPGQYGDTNGEGQEWDKAWDPGGGSPGPHPDRPFSPALAMPGMTS